MGERTTGEAILLMNYRGILEVNLDVEAESEEEAQRKMADILIERLKARAEEPESFIVWPHPVTTPEDYQHDAYDLDPE